LAAIRVAERRIVALDPDESRAYRTYLRARLAKEEMQIPEGVLAARKIAIMTAGVGEIVEMHAFESDEPRAGTRCVEIYVGRPTGVVRWDQSGPQVEVSQEKHAPRVVLMLDWERYDDLGEGSDLYDEERRDIERKGGVVLELPCAGPAETTVNHVTLATEVHVWREERDEDKLPGYAKRALVDARALGRPILWLPHVLGT